MVHIPCPQYDIPKKDTQLIHKHFGNELIHVIWSLRDLGPTNIFHFHCKFVIYIPLTLTLTLTYTYTHSHSLLLCLCIYESNQVPSSFSSTSNLISPFYF